MTPLLCFWFFLRRRANIIFVLCVASCAIFEKKKRKKTQWAKRRMCNARRFFKNNHPLQSALRGARLRARKNIIATTLHQVPTRRGYFYYKRRPWFKKVTTFFIPRGHLQKRKVTKTNPSTCPPTSLRAPISRRPQTN